MKGGCIEALDWSKAIHIWCKRASESHHHTHTRMSLRKHIQGLGNADFECFLVVPIPEGCERAEEEPEEDFGIGAVRNNVHNGGVGPTGGANQAFGLGIRSGGN